MEQGRLMGTYLKFDSQQASIFKRCIEPNKYFKSNKNSLNNLEKQSFEARGLSPTSAKKIKKKVRALYFLTKQNYINHLQKNKNKLPTSEYKKVVFVTLTLPSAQMHTDNYIKKTYLNQFLIEVQKRAGIDLYLWRAEKQKNGNIHFHIVFNKNVYWGYVRRVWNRILSKGKENYISEYSKNQKEFYKNGFRMRPDGRSEQRQREAYNRGLKCGFIDPNSTDVKVIDNEKKVESYISKYLSKNENENDETRLVSGKIWGCSRELSTIKEATMLLEELESTDKVLFEKIQRELEKSERIEIREEGYQIDLFFNKGSWYNLLNLVKSHYLNCLYRAGFLSSSPPLVNKLVF